MAEALEVEELGPHHTLQYETPAHQADTAEAGMWLFLATEVLFFGALFLGFLWVQYSHPQGYALAARHTDLLIGTANAVVLATSSAVFALAVLAHEAGNPRPLLPCCYVIIALGVAFLVLKGIEWSDDFDQSLFPGPQFALLGQHEHGARLFYVLYFVATGLHGVHLLVGIGLVAVLAWRARRGALRPAGPDGRPWTTPVAVTGLYWSFVDMIWLVLYPLIYILGRAS